MALNGTGQVGPMGTALYVTVPGKQWGIAIRRIDMDSDPAFGPFHAAAVTEADIKALIPGWQNLNWTHHVAPLNGLPRESRATDGPYRIYLIYGGAVQPAAAVAELAADLA
jgi:hypothetical protein